MPTYEYKCDSCGKIFDEYQSIKDKPLKECKFCKGPVKRMIHAAGIVFKGSGFHVTDYGKGKGSHADKTATSSGKATEKTIAKGSAENKKPA